MQVGESAGAECKAALQETTQLVEQKLATNGKALKASFNATDVCSVTFFTLAKAYYSLPLTCATFPNRFCSIILMLRVDLCLVLQLEIDGDFLYFLADAAATAVVDMNPAV